MTDLLVRSLDDNIVKALKARAAANGRSAEAEHRDILAAALVRPHRRSLAEVLAAMPDVGRDADFERTDSTNASTTASTAAPTAAPTTASTTAQPRVLD